MELEVSRLKALLGIEADDTTKDASLSFILADVEEIIKNYCNISIIPAGLVNTAYRMAMDIYNKDVANGGTGTASAGAVASITEGDVSVSYASDTAGTTAYCNSILKNYKAQLNHYRKLVW